MKTRILLLVLIMMTAASSLQAQRRKITKVGYIDIQKIIDKVVADQNLRAVLEGKRADYIRKSQKIAEDVEKLKEKLRLEADTLSEERKTQILDEIKFKEDELRQYIEQQNTDLRDREQKTTYKVYKEIYQYIKKVAQEEGYSLIIEKSSAIIYADDEVNITDQVLEELEKAKQLQKEN